MICLVAKRISLHSYHPSLRPAAKTATDPRATPSPAPTRRQAPAIEARALRRPKHGPWNPEAPPRADDETGDAPVIRQRTKHHAPQVFPATSSTVPSHTQEPIPCLNGVPGAVDPISHSASIVVSAGHIPESGHQSLCTMRLEQSGVQFPKSIRFCYLLRKGVAHLCSQREGEPPRRIGGVFPPR